MRRIKIFSLGAFLGIISLCTINPVFIATALASSAEKPNIVFILVDDMGYSQIACNGNSFYVTSAIDRLASQGMRFTDAYAAAPVCSPTRAGLMTGKYPARLHVTDYIPGRPYPFAKLETPAMSMGISVEEDTLAEMLGRAGYVSGHFGKWHLNEDKEYAPDRPGDPASQGFSDVLTTHKPEYSEVLDAAKDPDYDAHHVWEITERATAFMEKNKDRPFFCYIPHHTIHRPDMEFAPKIVEYAAKPEAGNPQGNNPIHGAMVETLDKSIKVLLDKIDELGIADNTIVVFTSDNGGFYGREARNPLYGAKADLHEGGVRVPLIIRWPDRVKAGTVSHEMVSSIDFYPTFAQMVGQEITDPEIDGVNILPALQGEKLERDTLYWHYPHYHSLGIAPAGSIREGRYKLIEWYEKSLLEGPEAEGALQLFDLEADIGERKDLASEMPQRAKEMYAKLCGWREEVGVQMMRKNPKYDPEKAGWGDLDGR